MNLRGSSILDGFGHLQHLGHICLVVRSLHLLGRRQLSLCHDWNVLRSIEELNWFATSLHSAVVEWCELRDPSPLAPQRSRRRHLPLHVHGDVEQVANTHVQQVVHTQLRSTRSKPSRREGSIRRPSKSRARGGEEPRDHQDESAEKENPIIQEKSPSRDPANRNSSDSRSTRSSALTR